jgi:small subunit ribosomal protein S16
MLVIRLQRTGRKAHAMFRMVVQDSRRTPTSGKVVAWLGSYDPHAKNLAIDKEKATFFLSHGAQPSDRVARLLKHDGIELPDWVKLVADKKREVRNADKRRSTRPPEPVEEVEEAPVATEEAEATPEETVAEEPESKTDEPEEATSDEPESTVVEAPVEEAEAESTEKPEAAAADEITEEKA